MISEFLQFLMRMSLSNNQILRDAEGLRVELLDIKKELILFTHDEMEILSLSSIDKGSRRGFFKIKKGVFNTIYFEPLIAYATKIYSPTYRLILVTTSDREIIYFVKDNWTQVYFAGRELGRIDQAGNLFNTRNQLIGQIDGNDNIPTHTVHIRGEDFGFISNPKFEEKRQNRRAYQMLKEMTEDERSIFLSLTLLNLVEESLL